MTVRRLHRNSYEGNSSQSDLSLFSAFQKFYNAKFCASSSSACSVLVVGKCIRSQCTVQSHDPSVLFYVLKKVAGLVNKKDHITFTKTTTSCRHIQDIFRVSKTDQNSAKSL